MAVDAPSDVINALSGKIGRISGISSKWPMPMNRHLIDKLADGGELTRQELARLITDDSREIAAYLAERANAARDRFTAARCLSAA